MSVYSPSNITSSSSYRWATVWVTTLLAAAALIVGALANSASATDDAIGPDIQSLTVTPASARPGDTVTISMAVTDETGVQDVAFYMQVGGTWNNICDTSTSRVSGDALSGTWEKVCTIPNPVLNGTYVVTPFAQDVLGRYTNMNGQNPIALTTQLTITGGTDDAIGPDIQSLTVTPASARPGDTVTISMAVTDETGVQDVAFYMQVGGTWNNICDTSTSRVSGDALSGTWEKVCTIPNPVLNGTYVVTPFAQDVLGRYTNMNGQNPIALTTQLTITDAPTPTTTTTTVPASSTTTTTTTTVPASSTTTTTTTTVPDSSTTTTTTVPAPEVFVPQSQVAAPVTTIAAPVVPATTVVSTTSTTSTTLAPVVVPDAPLAEPGAASVVVDGEAVDAELLRSENRLVLTAGDVSATAYGETADGVRIPLDESGALRLESGDVIVVEGAGFEPGAEVEVWMMSTPTLLGDLVADRSGAVSGRFVPPVTLEPGEHRLVLSGEVPVVLAFGVFVGSEATALRLGFPLWIPVSIAIGLALIVPTRYIRRRRALTDGAH